MSKKKILVFIDWFYPAFKAGGPIRSVFNIIDSLSDQLDFYVVTSAYDLGESTTLPNVELNKWQEKNKYSIIYLTSDHQNLKVFREIIGKVNPDKVYFNSLFSINFTLLPMLLIKNKSNIILAPRGMLGLEALKIKSFKKKLFIKGFGASGMFSKIIWHASSKLEEQEIKYSFGKSSNVVVAQNIASTTTKRPIETITKVRGELNLVFFSRINEKKNLNFAVEVLASMNTTKIRLDIYGPKEDLGYYDSIMEVVKSENLNVHYGGVLTPKDLPFKLWEYHYLLFPTKHENYGHVIAESLCASLPIIISENTPWRNLSKYNVGYDLKLDKSIFIETIKLLLNQNQNEYKTFVDSAYNYSKKYILDKSIIEQNKQLFLS